MRETVPTRQLYVTELVLSVLAKTQLIWNDRCQHPGLTWRRPGGARRDRFDDQSL